MHNAKNTRYYSWGSNFLTKNDDECQITMMPIGVRVGAADAAFVAASENLFWFYELLDIYLKGTYNIFYEYRRKLLLGT